jgi:hypothetical protein
MSGTDIELPETMDANPEPEDHGTPPGDRPLTAREQIMARAVENRQAQIDADNAQAAIYDREATDAGLNFPPDEEQPVEPVPRVEPPVPRQERAPVQGRSPAAAPVQPLDEQPQARVIEIDGQRFAITPEQERELFRLGMYAGQALQQYRPEPPPPPEPPRPLVDPEAVRETVRRMQYSGEEDAAAALTDLITGVISRVPQAPQVDPNALVNRAVFATQEQMRIEAAKAKIQEEYPDIATNSQLARLANMNHQDLLAHYQRLGVQKPWLDMYREASQAVYDAIGKPRPGSDPRTQPVLQAPSNALPRQEVLERKRATPKSLTSVDMRAPPPTNQQPRTGSEIVNQMRLSRGLSSLT